jgi:serine/threonine protein kinase
MPEIIRRAEFVRNLGESGLFSDDDLRRALAVADADPTSSDTDGLAEHLIRSGHLTTFQADAVLRRRFDELRVGNYDVLERLGAGGMGTVYKARHRRMKRVVALKVLAAEPARKASFAPRFQREVETIAKLTHPNIVMAFDADESDAGPFLVMEFVDGRDLGVTVQERGPLALADAIDAILQAARGLEYAHQRGFIHRDVKPANLLRDASGLTKVADLGLARLDEAEGADAVGGLTLAGNVVGTAEFMPPEQAVDSSAVDPRADIYALGCTLYYLVTGRAPYRATSLMGLLLAHRDAPIPALRAARPDAPEALETLFQRMVAKKAGDRLPTMTAVIAALEDIQEAILRHAPETSGFAATTEFAPDRTYTPTATWPGAPLSGIGAVPSSSEVRRVADLAVVLVEPSRTQAGIIRTFLEQLGIAQIHATGSGAEALAVVKSERADVLLSAMHLSDMTGLDLARTLRGDPECRRVGFVLASSASEGGRSDADLIAHLAILPKPFDLRTLARALAEAAGLAIDEARPTTG